MDSRLKKHLIGTNPKNKIAVAITLVAFIVRPHVTLKLGILGELIVDSNEIVGS